MVRREIGFDTVELVAAVEETFDIAIPDAVAARLNTVGDLHACFVERVHMRIDVAIVAAAIFVRLRDLICKQLWVRPDDVVPRAMFVEDLRAD